jgi:hypothetical protein
VCDEQTFALKQSEKETFWSTSIKRTNSDGNPERWMVLELVSQFLRDALLKRQNKALCYVRLHQLAGKHSINRRDDPPTTVTAISL